MQSLEDSPPTHSRAQERIIGAARKLFGEHGVSGTSLQMIADEIGVTKAAVYHQFKSKDDIVVATTEEPLRRLAKAVEAAEADPDPSRAVEVLLGDMVDQAVEHRAIINQLNSDPLMQRTLARYGPPRDLMHRLYRCLTRGDDHPATRVRVAAAASAIGSACVHPLAADIDEDALRVHLLEVVTGILGAKSDTATASALTTRP